LEYTLGSARFDGLSALFIIADFHPPIDIEPMNSEKS